MKFDMGGAASVLGVFRALVAAAGMTVIVGRRDVARDCRKAPVFIEAMAIWCTKCRAQQHDVEKALARLPADQVVWATGPAAPRWLGDSGLRTDDLGFVLVYLLDSDSGKIAHQWVLPARDIQPAG